MSRVGSKSSATGAIRCGLRHIALLYRSRAEYLARVCEFLRAGVAQGEAMLVAVPADSARYLEDLPHDLSAQVTFVDMTELGRNPARIMPTVESFIAACDGQAARYVGEPIWAGRSADEIREATRHEAMINRAFRSAPISALCAYDVTGLPPPILADARRTHPLVIADGRRLGSASFRADSFPPGSDQPLPGPPESAQAVRFGQDLHGVRHLVSEAARAASLPVTRAADLVLAVSELAANTLKHTCRGGSVHVWLTADDIFCQAHDHGHIHDPLVGQRAPDLSQSGHQGLWVVNQVCDLVEIRSDAGGTSIRLRMRRGGTRGRRRSGGIHAAVSGKR